MALSAAAQARTDPRPLDSTALRATVDGQAEMWPFEVFMDGAAYSWRIHFPSDIQYDGYLVAFKEGSGPWNILDARGHIRQDTASESLLNALSSSASLGQFPSQTSALQQGMSEDSAYYFPGYQAKAFQLAQAPSNGQEAFTPLSTQRMIEQVLPSPALLNPQGPVTAYVALKRKGSSTVDGLVITTEAEYVTGERAFFSQAAYAGKSYEQKALALMDSSFQGTESDTAFRAAALEAYPGLSMGTSDWSMFAADPELATMQKRMLTQFLNSLLSQTDYTDKGRVFEGLDSPTWQESLYGVNRLPQVASYMRYAYDTGMPLWSESIAEDHPGYDWQGYVPVSGGEGAALAKAALRYYTWGLDYAMPTKGDSTPVFGPPEYLANKDAVTAWVAPEAGSRSALSDYLPTTPMNLDATTMAGASGLPQGWTTSIGADSPFAKGMAGNPLPCARGGTDGPWEFAQAMVGAYAGAREPGYALPPPGRGVDDLGLLTGALAMTVLSGSVENLAGSDPGTNLDAYWRTGTTGSGADRLIREDLEKCSIVVPELDQLRAGDLVVHYGQGEGKSADPLRLGVVVYAPASGMPQPGQDEGIYLSQVLVVSAQEGTRQVRLASWQDSFGILSGQTHIRRLVRTKPLVSRAFDFKVGGSGPISLLMTEMADGILSYTSSYDCDYRGVPAGQRQKWIPNTGQYLAIQGMKITLKNPAGISIDRLSAEIGKRLSMFFILQDRNWTNDATLQGMGNIYNNSGKIFEMAAIGSSENFFKNAAELVTLLSANAGPEPESDNPAVQTLYYYSTNRATGLTTDRNGNLEYDGKTTFGIRPQGKAYPGDDIILGVDIESLDTGKLLLRKEMAGTDYFAVYDKKMLWRANLYINQPEPDYSGKDWNVAFPWDAPPAAGATVDGGNPAWGRSDPNNPASWDDKSWGYNEWNRTMAKVPTFQNGATVGLANLPVGDGGQVVTIPDFTPLRTLPANSQTPNDENWITNTVAYSLPSHQYEPIQGGAIDETGWSGSQDSPFDYAWKMIKQKALLGANYDFNGNGKTQQSASSWARTRTPDDSWKTYETGSSSSPSYIPELGLWHGDKKNGNNEAGVDTLLWDQDFVYEAGTDCLGLVQRAAGWSGSTTTSYTWQALLPGMMEYGNGQGTNSPKDVYTTAAAQQRHFPTGTTDSVVIMACDQLSHNASMLNALRQVVPGDIWLKYSTVAASQNGATPTHIAVVARVPDNPYSISDPITYMNQMILIEGEYTNKIQSVIKVLSVGDYNNGKLTGPRSIYGEQFALGSDESLDLNCQSWAIRRLR